MRLLLLGGPSFLGRHVVEAAFGLGHDVSMFNRGKTNPELFPDVEKLRGDRSKDLGALEGRNWDAVIDTSGRMPKDVWSGVTLLRDAVVHYTFVSSLTVYADLSAPEVGEEAELLDLEPYRSRTEMTPENYGPFKALCEESVLQSFNDQALIVRPGLILGPHDYTNRSTYWVQRVAEGGEILAPGNPDRQIQIIDVRDLAVWLVHMAERREHGVYNVTGPDFLLTMGNFLEACCSTIPGEARLTWVDETFLADRKVAYWSDLPLWLPDSLPWRLNIDKALRSGLEFRSVASTITDIHAWLGSRRHSWPVESVWSSGGTVPVGISREKEEALLQEWRLHTV